MSTFSDPGAQVGPETVAEEIDSRRGKAGWIRPLLLAVAGLTLICAVGCLLIALSSVPWAPSSAPAGLPITVCAGVAVQPRIQAGIVWVSAISSYLPPVAASTYSVCFRLPSQWVPSTPWGEWVFPP